MRGRKAKWLAVGIALGAWAWLGAAAAPDLGEALGREFDLGRERSAEAQRFRMETRVKDFAPDGTPTGSQTLRMLLSCVPVAEGGAEYTCKRFTYQQGDGPALEIPALAGWSYTFAPTPAGTDEQGQVFGIDHARFEGLTDETGAPLPPQTAYVVYNSFIDFHAFCDVFAGPMGDGAGIEDLRRIGDRVVHAAAHTKAPVNLGSNIAEGSYFQNGEVTLALKGVGLVDGAACAMVRFDSGQSSFRIMFEPMPGMQVTAVGGSHYFGDVYVDLATMWPRLVEMGELVVSRTEVPEPAVGVNAVTERTLVIESVSAEQFEAL